MSKKKEALTSKQRFFKSFAIPVGIGFLIGIGTAFFEGFFYGLFDEANYDFETVKRVLLWTSRSLASILMLATISKMIQAKRLHTYYLETDEEDEELVDNYYRATFRSLETGIVFSHISTTLVVFGLAVSNYFSFRDFQLELKSSSLDFLLLMILIVVQSFLFKLIQKIRNYKLSAFATVKEIKEYVDSLDEGERQANLERAFLTVFNLNQIILPSLYLIVFFISIVSQTQQLVAYLVIAAIHTYINIVEIKSIRAYFK